MPLIQANGVKLHVQQLGTSGSMVAMIHGLMLGTKSTWFFGVAPAIAESHRVLLYDLRGHGLSERCQSGFTLRDMTADLCAVIESSGEDKVTLVGHSYGGSLALRYASMYPDRVRKLVLVEAPVPVISQNLQSLLWVKARQKEAEENTGEELLERLNEDQKQELFGDLPPVMQDALTRIGRRPNLLLAQILGLIADTTMLEDVMAEPPFEAEELERVTCPVLLCYGERSLMMPEPGHMLLTALRDVELRPMKGGHSLPQEATTELIETIQNFLAD
jgi:pimeloyl-ACP methyl ester carboxylesterase